MSALVWASAASGATTIGQFATTASPPTASCTSDDRDILQPTVTSGNTFVVPPLGDTITNWSHLAAAGAGQTLTFKVFRKVGEPSTYQVVGHDGPRPIAEGVLNSFPISMSVKPGDVIGLNSANAGTVPNACVDVVGGGESHLFHIPGLADGASDNFNNQPNSRLNVTAVVEPSNRITLGDIRRNKKKGTASVVVTVPGPGELSLTGNKVKTAASSGGASKSAPVSGPGDVTLTIKPRKKTKKKLARKGKATVSVDISYTPTGGALAVRNEQVKLKKKRKKK